MSYRFLSPKTAQQHNASQWDARSLEGELESFHGRTLARLFENYLPGGPARVLEGGCGLGAWCEWLKRRGYDVVGIENEPYLVERAHERKPDIDVELGDVTDLNYGDNSFDAYVSLGVIEHFELGPQKALSEAYRILKPGGIAFVSTPYLNGMRRLIAHPVRGIYFFFRRLRGKPANFWEYRFSEDELRSLVVQAGFEVISAELDDYETDDKNRHIGLWTDWFFLREPSGGVWQLNRWGRVVLRLARVFPAKWFCSALCVVARTKKNI